MATEGKLGGLLVLTRELDQAVRVGDEVEIHVLAIHRGKVQLGFRAPRGVPIHREEVFQEIQRQRASAGGGAPAVEV